MPQLCMLSGERKRMGPPPAQLLWAFSPLKSCWHRECHSLWTQATTCFCSSVAQHSWL